ncbi:MAG TPA: carboxylesterase [Janthinobacterium sp.]|nr:carboxylesterase [Janthinobacterium sp.]
MLTALINHLARRPAPPAPVADPDALRATPLGPLVGFADQRGTHAWLGIAYAQPPVGSLRWKAPRAPLAWREPKAALAYGPIAMQFAGETIGAPESTWGSIVGSEDCLTLNVRAPRMTPVEARLARLPVMVWIHGGGNTVGTAAAYPVLRNLAGHDQVLVVSLNYRLGIFGWFSLAELASDGDTPEDRSGNFGTLDIIAALNWVRQNIASFGGDPDNVTVFGESAGALNVYSLLASPLAKGLFHKAIAQSPLTLSNTVEQARSGHALGSRALLERWRCAPDALRARPAAELLAAIVPGPLGFYDTPQLLRDGVVLPLAPMQELFTDTKRYNAVPLIIGSNRDEYKLFMAKNPEFVRMVFGKVPLIRDRAAYERYARYMSDLWKAACVDQQAASMVASGNADVWVYRFDWDEHPDLPFIHPPVLLGANHALEMAFVMRDVDGELDPFRCVSKSNRAGRQQVSDAMGDYWTSFARHGAPKAGAALPAWRRWRNQADADKLMLFDSDAGGGVRMDRLQLDPEALGRALDADPAFQPQERVKLYARMFRWSAFVEPISAAQFSSFARRHGQDRGADEFRPTSWP